MRGGGARGEGGRPRNPWTRDKGWKGPKLCKCPPNPWGGQVFQELSVLWWDAGRCHAWASVRVQRPPRPTCGLCRAVSLGSPSAGVGSPQGTQSAREPTGGARELPPEPCAGLRPLARPPVVSGSLPGPLGSRGDKTHPLPLRSPLHQPGPRGRLQRGSAEHRALRGAEPPAFQPGRGAWGLASPSLWVQTGWAPRRVPERWRGTRPSSLSPFSWGESAFSPSPYGHFLWPGSASPALCPGCQLERIT